MKPFGFQTGHSMKLTQVFLWDYRRKCRVIGEIAELVKYKIPGYVELSSVFFHPWVSAVVLEFPLGFKRVTFIQL